MIEVEGLTKQFGSHLAVDGLSFAAEKGEVVGFLGPNGAGKTTTMRILTCYFPATRGKATVAGFDCFEDSLEVRRRVGYLPENVPLYRDMAVDGYLKFVAGIKGVERRDVAKQVSRVMGECGLDEVSRKLIGTLSKGYRQRVGLAQALVNDPEVLILDEPTNGLDPRQIQEIRKLIKQLAGQRTVILSTHILPEVSMVCGRVIIVNKGHLVAVDTPENLTAQMQRSSKLVLRIAGDGDQIEPALRRLEGVKEVVREEQVVDGVHGFVVDLDEGGEVRGRLAPLIVEQGWNLVEMRPLAASLEDVFIQLVMREDAA